MEASFTRTSRHLLLALLLILVTVLCFDLKAQRRRRAQPRKAAPSSASRIDYSKFMHATKEHRGACNTCHRAPTSNWNKVRGFPDIADFPDHDACVRCHRPQFFKSAQPVICSGCHTKVSPRDEARFTFRNPARTRQFRIEFPHDKHQDVIALLQSERPAIARAESVTKRVLFAHAPQDRVDYNNCTICHATRAGLLAAPAQGWTDAFVPKTDSFKTVPAAHTACFNCHWKNQAPTKDNCDGCHKLETPHFPEASPARISMKFNHEGGGGKHLAECTTCHINITKSASVRGLKPDVPITNCTECHNKPGLREDLDKELVALDKNRNFVCTYCHTSDVGKRDAKPSHYLVAERKPLTRKDIK
ncbi:MAG TPA: cytochrome c3 family protein [Pyrinomonadaceae bacterium]|nr:cytochrome c3 family protein [Pyrinomonadaceae bacterium]